LSVLTQRLHCPELVDVAEIEGEGLVGPSSLVLSVSSRTSDERAASCGDGSSES
jgi:hypothetical protein